MNPVDTIRSAIERHGLFPAGCPVVAAVSGGADSTALLHALHRLDIPFTVAHLNHRLRGKESDGDETFVRRLAEGLGLPFRTRAVDVGALAEARGLSIEMAARAARHAFFGEFGDAVIALAHHADDQVETFLLRLARGAGSEGLAGMPFMQTIGTLRLARPMLELTREEITAWLAGNGLEWREDASNADGQYLRNRVRNTVLPILEHELNPAIREAILRTMDILRAENEWMNGLADSADPGTAGSLPRAARRRILRKQLFQEGAGPLSCETVDRILDLMDKGCGSTAIELNDRQQVVVEYGVPRLECRMSDPAGPEWELTVEAGTGWKRDPGREIGRLPAEASFNAARVDGAPIEVRTVRPGDRIEPLGMEGSRKLQDIFTDAKIPRARRSRIPVVVCRGEIIWLPGYRIARDWAVPAEEAKAVHVRLNTVPCGESKSMS